MASQLFPGRTLLVATEKGYNAIGGIRKVDVDTWSDFRTVVTQLTAKKKKEKARAMYDCVMVDVADRLPNLCNSYTCQSFDPLLTILLTFLMAVVILLLIRSLTISLTSLLYLVIVWFSS